MGSLAQVAYANVMHPALFRVRGADRSLGTSGALSGMMVFNAIANPSSIVSLYGIIPFQIRYLVGGLMVWDLYHALRSPYSRDGHAAHLGGGFAGALFYFMLRRRFL